MAQESIFQYIDYKAYLKAVIKVRPKAGRGVLSRMATALEMTPAQMSHVTRSDRHLTFEQALRATKFLGLNPSEADFFIEMVMLARAGTPDLKAFSKRRIEALKKEGLKIKHQVPAHRELSDAEKAKFYSSWVYSAVRLSSSIRPLQIEDIMREFHVSRGRASEIFNFLVETSLCLQSEKGISMGTRATFVPKTSPFVFKHHSNWRVKALEKIEEGNDQNLFFTSPVSLSRNDFERLHVRLTEVVKEFSSVVQNSPEEIVGCLNIDFFKVSEE